jgi:hypothetical protein
VAADAGPAVKAGAAGAKGNVLTRKIGPLPGWAWAAVAVGGYYLYKKYKGSSTAASTTAATTASTGDNGAALPTSDTTAPSGYAYQGPGVGSGGSGAVPTGAMGRTSRHHSGVGSPTTTGTTPATAVTAATTSPQIFYNTGASGTTATVNPTALAAPGQSNTPAAQQAAATQNPDGSITYGAPTISNQAIANQGLLESLGYTPAQVAAMQAQ